MSATITPRPHPLNQRFSWVDHRGPFRVLTDEQARQFDELGFVLLEDVVPPEVVERVVAAADPFEAELEDALRQLGGSVYIARADEITFTTHIAGRSEVLRRFVSAPFFRDLCHDLIGPDVRLYWDQVVYKKPGTEAPFPWHQDNGYAFLEPQAYLTCWIALTDATVDNGCPLVVPRLHRSGTLAHDPTDIGLVCLADPPDVVTVEAPAGSVVVFSSLTPHATGPNRTEHVRKAFIAQYAPDGAEICTVDEGNPVARGRADDPDRQWLLLSGGQPVDGMPDGWP